MLSIKFAAVFPQSTQAFLAFLQFSLQPSDFSLEVVQFFDFFDGEGFLDRRRQLTARTFVETLVEAFEFFQFFFLVLDLLF